MDIRVPDVDLGRCNDIVYEPVLLHGGRPGRVVIGHKLPREEWGPKDKAGKNGWRQELVDVADLASTLVGLAPRDDVDYYVSQNTLQPGARTHEASQVHLLTALWVDIDGLRERLGVTPEAPGALADELIVHVRELGLPDPTLVNVTGQGLHAKWLLAAPLLAGPFNLRRWEAAQFQLGERFEALRWPVDRGARDAPRVLRLAGTINSKTGTRCRALRVARRVDFEEVAEVLQRLTDRARAAAVAAGVTVAVAPPPPARAMRSRSAEPAASAPAGTPAPAMPIEMVRAMWSRRLDVGVSIIRARGGAQEGQRNDLFWVLANAVAWVSRSEDELHGRLARLNADLFSGGTVPWTFGDALNSAWSVIRRFGRGDDLYPLAEAEYLLKLGVPPEQHRHYRGRLAEPRPNAGARKYPKFMGWEPPDVHAVRLKFRRQITAMGSTQMSLERRGIDSRERLSKRSQALAWHAEGRETPTTISRVLGVPRRTIKDWIEKAAGGAAFVAQLEASAAEDRARQAAEEQANAERSAEIWRRARAMGSGGSGEAA